VRTAAIVIAAAMVVWMAGGWIGGRMGWPIAYAIMLDLACLAALGWALVMVLRLWRDRNAATGSGDRREKEN
jgi:type VI protein secretion system component VasK